MPSQPVGEMLEVALLRLLVAGLIGVDSNGVPNFTYPNFGGSGGGGIPITPPTGTYTAFHVANNGSTTIPTTAKRWAVNFVGTGTGNTFLGNTSVTGNQSFSDNGAPASAIAIGCDASTVADGFYSTT